MRDVPVSPVTRAHRGQITEALARIEEVVVDGLRHGFFDCSIACEIGNGGKRQLVIRAASRTSSPSPKKNCHSDTALKAAIPETGTPEDANQFGSSVIGGIPRPEPPVRSSMKPSHANDNLKDDLIQRTRQLWQPRLARDLSREDARQITANITGFFSVLAEWSRAEIPSPANDAGEIQPTGIRCKNSPGGSAQCGRAAKPNVGGNL